MTRRPYAAPALTSEAVPQLRDSTGKLYTTDEALRTGIVVLEHRGRAVSFSMLPVRRRGDTVAPHAGAR